MSGTNLSESGYPTRPCVCCGKILESVTDLLFADGSITGSVPMEDGGTARYCWSADGSYRPDGVEHPEDLIAVKS